MVRFSFQVILIQILCLLPASLIAKKSSSDLFMEGFEADRNYMQENKLEHYLTRAILKLEEYKPLLFIGAGVDIDGDGIADTYLKVFSKVMDLFYKESIEHAYGVEEDINFIKSTLVTQQTDKFRKIENTIPQIDGLITCLRTRLKEAEDKKATYKKSACKLYVQSRDLSQTILTQGNQGAFLPSFVFGTACEKLVLYDPSTETNLDRAKKTIKAGADAALAAAQLAEAGKEGVPQDDGIAYLWNLRAADGKNPEAMYQTALRLKAGIGMPKDNVRSDKWLRAEKSDMIKLNGLTYLAVTTREDGKKTYVVLDQKEYKIETLYDEETDLDLDFIFKEDNQFLVIDFNGQKYICERPENRRYYVEVNGSKLFYKIQIDEKGEKKKIFEFKEGELENLQKLQNDGVDTGDPKCCESSCCCCCPKFGRCLDTTNKKIVYFVSGFFGALIPSALTVFGAQSQLEDPVKQWVLYGGIPSVVCLSFSAGAIGAWYSGNKDKKDDKKPSEKSKLKLGIEKSSGGTNSLRVATQTKDDDHDDLELGAGNEQRRVSVIAISEDSDSTEDEPNNASNDRQESLAVKMLRQKLAEQKNAPKSTPSERYKRIAQSIQDSPVASPKDASPSVSAKAPIDRETILRRLEEFIEKNPQCKAEATDDTQVHIKPICLEEFFTTQDDPIAAAKVLKDEDVKDLLSRMKASGGEHAIRFMNQQVKKASTTPEKPLKRKKKRKMRNETHQNDDPDQI